MIDWDRVAELRDEIGEEDLAEVVEMFLDEVAEKLADLKAGVIPQSIAEDMHFLKSSALNIGFATLAGLCSDAEVAASDDPSSVDLGKVEECFKMSCQELRAEGSIRAA